MYAGKALALILALAMLPLGTAQPGPIEVEFTAPAQVEGDVTAAGGIWLALFFMGDGQGAFQINTSSSFTVSNYTYKSLEGEAEPAVGFSRTALPLPPQDNEAPAEITLHFQRGVPGSLILHAKTIHLSAQNQRVQLTSQNAQISPAEFAPREVFEENPYWDWTDVLVGPNVLSLFRTNASATEGFSIEAFDLESLQWFGARIYCPSQVACPDGGGRHDTTLEVGPGISSGSVEYSYGQATVKAGSLMGEGASEIAMLAGPQFNVLLKGSIRLPSVNAQSNCRACFAANGQTLAANGDISLAGLRLAGEGRMATQLGGDIFQARLDEVGIDPKLLAGPFLITGAAATAGLVALIKWLIAPFFTRLTKEQALEHPRRKQIFDYVQAHPGANFREVARNTGIAAGTVRHHLNVLERSDILVEHTHGSTVRLFENNGRFQENWADLVLLREPALGQLHAWLKENPASPQKAVLEGMEPQGWSRSTTQHRLARLVEGGLASIRLQGRLKIYSVVERVKPRGLQA